MLDPGSLSATSSALPRLKPCRPKNYKTNICNLFHICKLFFPHMTYPHQYFTCGKIYLLLSKIIRILVEILRNGN